MKLLLDTHTFLWFIGGDSQLSQPARLLIEDRANQSIISIASIWEMAIKVSIGKLRLGQPFEVLIPQQIQSNGFGVLGIDLHHVTKIATLPFYHPDPFDRIMVAQSIEEQLPIVSGDPAFDSYSVTRLW